MVASRPYTEVINLVCGMLYKRNKYAHFNAIHCAGDVPVFMRRKSTAILLDYSLKLANRVIRSSLPIEDSANELHQMIIESCWTNPEVFVSENVSVLEKASWLKSAKTNNYVACFQQDNNAGQYLIEIIKIIVEDHRSRSSFKVICRLPWKRGKMKKQDSFQ
jgi:hypothetical protein